MGAVVEPKLVFDAFPGNIINNTLVSTKTTRRSIDPSTGKPLWDVPVATKSDLDAAVRHARSAFTTWSKTSFQERSRLLLAFADKIEEYSAEFAKLTTIESGKPFSLGKAEAQTLTQNLRGYAQIEIQDEILQQDDERVVYSTWVPLGVCVGIVPWNWPSALAVMKIGPALMTGNCIIVKTSPFTPYGGLKLGEIGMSIFPPGVLQVLSGDDSLGPWMTEHPDVDFVSFTGSIPTGKLVAQSCAKTLKRVILELGGNDPAIVCEDVDVEKCVARIAPSAFAQSGQICVAIKRIYVHEKIYDRFRDAMVQFTKENLRVGGAFEEGVYVGPLQNKMQFDLVKGMYDDVRQHGWKPVLEGQVRDNQAGYIIEPCIIDNPPEDSRVVTEEAFGPIVPLLKWSDEDDVVARANALKTGLGASIWSKDLGRAERLGRQLSAGNVWVNSHLESDPNVPFGGHKESGFGVENGVLGFKQHMNHQSLWVFKKR